MAKFLVTGGTGFTGSHLVRRLVSDGHAVRVVARSARRAQELLPPQVEVVEGDLTDRAVVRTAMPGSEVVYHLAAAFREAGIPDARYRAVHVDATRRLLEAARSEGVRRFVHCSTAGVHGHVAAPPADEEAPFDPGDIYQVTKLEGERLAMEFQREHDFPVTVARPAAIYGPEDRRLLKLFRLVARRRFVMLGRGDVQFHLVHVDDLVAGLLLLAERPEAVGEAFILAGEEYRPLRALVEMIARSVEAPGPRLRLPAWPFFVAGAVCEAICVPLRVEPPIYRRRVAFFTKSRAFTIAKAKRLLGYQPRVADESGIRATAEWYRSNGMLR